MPHAVSLLPHNAPFHPQAQLCSVEALPLRGSVLASNLEVGGVSRLNCDIILCRLKRVIDGSTTETTANDYLADVRAGHRWTL
jgi:hypothetical protein